MGLCVQQICFEERQRESENEEFVTWKNVYRSDMQQCVETWDIVSRSVSELKGKKRESHFNTIQAQTHLTQFNTLQYADLF